MEITAIDHIVLTVTNIAETIKFYESVLGMEAELFSDGRTSLKFGTQKINLHQYGQEFEPKAKHPLPGSEDLCFISETKIDIAMKHVISHDITILDGPVERTGAIAKLVSFYFRDPDGNLIEVSNIIS